MNISIFHLKIKTSFLTFLFLIKCVCLCVGLCSTSRGRGGCLISQTGVTWRGYWEPNSVPLTHWSISPDPHLSPLINGNTHIYQSIVLIFVIKDICTCHMPMWRSEDSSQELVLSFHMWVSGGNLSSDLAVHHFINWAIPLAPKTFLKIKMLMIYCW